MKTIVWESVKTNPQDAVDLLKFWFSPDDIICLTGMPPATSSATTKQNTRIEAKTLVARLSSAEGIGILETLTDGLDVYFTIVPTTPSSSRGSWARVSEDESLGVIGVTCDLDVKDGSFSSEEDAMSFLGMLDVKPSAVVATGSGGLHAYWKFDERVTVTEGKELIYRWWTYLADVAEENFGAVIDRLIDVPRMLRLPGCVRYPKDLTEKPTLVMLRVVSDRRITPDQIRKLSVESVKKRENYVRKIRTQEVSMQPTIQLNNVVAGSWAYLIATSEIQDWFNEQMVWGDILSPLGWTYLRTDNSGREQWARPGRTDKSATVNWPESPHIMSLLSTSTYTGLSDLLEAGVPLTKWRVWLRLHWNDDVDGATASAYEEKIRREQ